MKKFTFSMKSWHVLFPVYKHEWPKFLTLTIMMFSLLFNYTLVRNLKDTLIATAQNSGAEVMTFIKVWLVLPAAFFMMWLIDVLISRVPRKYFFFVMTAPFVCFFFIHAYVLFPYQSFVSPDPETIAFLQNRLPHLRWVWPLWGNWVNVLFYVLAEIWGTACFYYLFWQIANQTTTKMQAFRFFSLFGVLGNSALIVGGRLGQIVSKHYQNSENGFLSALQLLIDVFGCSWLMASLACLALFYFIKREKDFGPHFSNEAAIVKSPTDKNNFTLKEQWQIFRDNEYIRHLVFIYFSYGLTINLMESLWKNQVKLIYPDPADYNTMMAKASEATGWGSVIFMLLGGAFMRKRWFWGAIATPMGILLAGGPFILMTVYRYGSEVWGWYAPDHFGWLIVTLGLVANVFAKSTKCSFFDPSRELVYTQLSQEMRSRGKIVVDMIGGRTGKAGGALSQQFFLLILAGTQVTISPYIAVIFFIFTLLWSAKIVQIRNKLRSQDPHNSLLH